ncbi:YfiT family bacillithiol transferase [Paenibacillus koleovorans]|uniref:YfiT family bacillithiol transferase n=1 Tax=Paenibacillus koleovorans TaxID=121608 RepID=UPI000FDA1CC5|nr:putative metal-dependent hydrolase [Paenibacillus koleovorans]
MDPLRYPIGSFQPVESFRMEQQLAYEDQLLRFAPLLRETVRDWRPNQLDTPYRPGGWTVRQVIHHLADNDMNAILRFKRALTEEQPTAGTYREADFAELADYTADVELSITLLESLHSRFIILLRSLQPSHFDRTFVSPTHGRMTLAVAAQRLVWHNHHHLAHIAALKQRMGWQ